MNNPPAFSNVNINLKEGIEVWGESGMTLRDYFAAKAMQGILFEGLEPEETAKHAYAMADAMLKAREQ